MSTDVCPICLDDDSTFEWTQLQCGHRAHTRCALESVLHGNLSCCMCRGTILKGLANEGAMEEAREEAQERIEMQERRRTLNRGLAGAKRSSCPVDVRRCVMRYTKARDAYQSGKAAQTFMRRTVRDAEKHYRPLLQNFFAKAIGAAQLSKAWQKKVGFHISCNQDHTIMRKLCVNLHRARMDLIHEVRTHEALASSD